MSDSKSMRRLSIAVFISGGGRSLANLIRHRETNALPIDIELVIASRDGIGGIEIAENAGIKTMVVTKPRSIEDESYSKLMFDPVREVQASVVVMAGFLKHVIIPNDFEDRVINIHPSLLPAFGGAGMYGDRVHKAVIDKKVKITGCTVHYVDNHYDNGPIIDQAWCPVEEQDDSASIAAKVFEKECELLPAVLRRLASQAK